MDFGARHRMFLALNDITKQLDFHFMNDISPKPKQKRKTKSKIETDVKKTIT